jgi:ribosome-associated translation inhibitor RaiA
VSLPGEKHVLRTESEKWDLHVAIDEAKDEMQSRMKKYRSKRTDSFDRGKRAWKKLMHLSGLAKRDGEE